MLLRHHLVAIPGLLFFTACSSSPGAVGLTEGGVDVQVEAGTHFPDANLGDTAHAEAGSDVIITGAGGCSDGIKDGTETDVDCGGSVCPMCDPGDHCKAASDCTSGVCTAGVCASPTCTDGVSNGGETGVDCGGGICPPCANGQDCQFARDCTSGVCQGGMICVAASCTDGMKDGTETGVDCGGSVCPACANGQGCLAGTDCTSMQCIASVCAQCATASDCPATGSECVTATCTANTCGTSDLGTSHVLSTGQTPGNCEQLVCNGTGGTESVPDATNVPVETTVCRVPACTGTPLAPTVTNAATGTDCTADNKPPAHVCGDTTNAAIAGTCVQCNTIADCPTTGSACVVATCTNNVCGTADAPTDTACTLATDAAAHVCADTTTTAGGTCVECNVLADCTNPLSVTCLLNMCQ